LLVLIIIINDIRFITLLQQKLLLTTDMQEFILWKEMILIIIIN